MNAQLRMRFLEVSMVCLVGTPMATNAWATLEEHLSDNTLPYSVDIADDIAVVGCEMAGAVWIYVEHDNVWALQQHIVPDSPAAESFGCAVALWENTLVVGAKHDSRLGDRYGSAYVYEFNGSSWVQRDVLTPSDGSAGDHFGSSVDVRGDLIVVGAEGSGNSTLNSGSAYIFHRYGDAWEEMYALTPTGADVDHLIGISVAIDQEQVLLATVGENCEGRQSCIVSVFSQVNEEEWVQAATMVTVQDVHGFVTPPVIGFSGGRLAVSQMYFLDDALPIQNNVCVYRRDGDLWQLETVLTREQVGGSEGFAYWVAIAGDVLLVADRGDGEPDSEKVYVFTFEDGLWTWYGSIDFPVIVTEGEGGHTVALSDDILVIAATGGDAELLPDPKVARRPRADYDGDRTADVSVYEPSTATWYMLGSSDGFTKKKYGFSGVVPLPADYDGDGRTDTTVFDPPSGNWYICQSGSELRVQQFGYAAVKPVPADYDGDGATDIAVFEPSTGCWYILASTDGFYVKHFGYHATIPVPADYDGDGADDVAVYDPTTSTWYILGSSAGMYSTQFGFHGVLPVPADYDGDGESDIAVFDPPSGTWYLGQSRDGLRVQQFGYSGVRPVPADYDGDGQVDIALFEPCTGNWYFLNSSDGFSSRNFGYAGVVPLY